LFAAIAFLSTALVSSSAFGATAAEDRCMAYPGQTTLGGLDMGHRKNLVKLGCGLRKLTADMFKTWTHSKNVSKNTIFLDISLFFLKSRFFEFSDRTGRSS
jgi:hypothetical protein